MDQLARQTELAKQFVWTAQDGVEMTPQEMTTRHLFYTIRMIWNHTMPEESRSSTFKRYRIHRSSKYLKAAVVALGTELLTRNDLQPEWEAEIQRWRNYLNGQKLLGAVGC